MTPTERTFRRKGANSQCQRILRALKVNRGQWVPMPELARIGAGNPEGFCMVHSRVADIRRTTGRTIRNKTTGSNETKRSFYKLL
jgi:hypothetical protein